MSVESILMKADDLIAKNLRNELRAQGHYLSGKLERSITGKVISIGKAKRLQGVALFYSKILHHGVKADRIPYGGTGKSSGTPRTSQYIQGLITYFMHRGLSKKEATSAAFATAKTHKRDGMPTANSYKHSSTGKRTGFIDVVNKAVGPDVDRLVVSGLDEMVNKKFHETKSEKI